MLKDCDYQQLIVRIKYALLNRSLQMSIQKRIQKSSAAAVKSALHELSRSQHFETQPLQHGLTRNITLPGLDTNTSTDIKHMLVSLKLKLLQKTDHITIYHKC